MNDPSLTAQRISYQYDSYQALKESSFSVNKGEILTITGPNGAGKTTLMKCLSGMLMPASGNVLVKGHDLYQREPEAKRELSFLPDTPRFYQELTVWEHLRFIAHAHSADQGFAERATALLQEFGLYEARDLYPHALSRGMGLKLGILLCLIRPFSVLLMDEPTSALDPQGVEVLNKKFEEYRNQGAAIVITTHDLSLASALGSRTAHMKGGQIALD